MAMYLRHVACVLTVLTATTDYQDEDIVKLEEKDKDMHLKGSKGRVATDVILHCLSEHP